MKFSVYSLDAKEVSDIEISDSIFLEKVNEHLIYLAIRSLRNNARSGNACTKTKAEVAISGAKPWRQKGTGRARIGTMSTPLRRGGGVAFGPKPRSFAIKLTKKMKKNALRSALTAKKDHIVILENLNLVDHKTKNVADIVKKFEISNNRVVFMDSVDNENFAKAARNIKKIDFISPASLNVYNIISSDKLFMTVDAVKKLEEAIKVG